MAMMFANLSNVPPAQAAGGEACKSRALADLKRLHPAGHRIYAGLANKSDFTHWITCDDVQLGLATAVHEGVHVLTEEIDAYPLIGGGRLRRVPASEALFPPRVLAPRFDAASTYVETYLRPGAATSAEEFGFLLDEFNAYAHDLHAAIALRRLATPGQSASHRDGLAALMAFVAAYIGEAERAHPATWRRLLSSDVRPTVARLWSQAEQVMGASCSIPDFGDETPAFLAPVCRATAQSALGTLLGRPPLCPVRCARPSVARADSD
ncbi:MAG: hypothetical protein KDJ37_01735 [Hyphomicrobiaceae bacterium]|nr:hypothetical protein [Hyphomicrobiaceae bacterium]